MGSSNRYFEAKCTFHSGRNRAWRAITEYLQLKIIGSPDSVVEIGPGYDDFINQVKGSRKIVVDIVDVSSHLAPEADVTDLRARVAYPDFSLSRLGLFKINTEYPDSVVSNR